MAELYLIQYCSVYSVTEIFLFEEVKFISAEERENHTAYFKQLCQYFLLKMSEHMNSILITVYY